MSQIEANQHHKDRLFIRIFSDLEHKDRIISLINAVSGTCYTENELVTVNTIEDILYIKMKNDVSYLIDHQLFLIEHQSSYNPNMPLRGLIYFGQLYDSYIQQRAINIYSTKLQKIPVPQFYVIYNGPKQIQDVSKLHLSDAFYNASEEKKEEFEWTATMFNINSGHNQSLLAACKPLREYAEFVNAINQGRKSGLSLDDALTRAVDYAIENNFLDGLFLKLKGDIMSILFKEYTDEEFKELFYSDGLEVGREEGAAEQRAKDEIELQTMRNEVSLLKAELERLKQKMTELHS